jgi:hypothetical protein
MLCFHAFGMEKICLQLFSTTLVGEPAYLITHANACITHTEQRDLVVDMRGTKKNAINYMLETCDGVRAAIHHPSMTTRE